MAIDFLFVVQEGYGVLRRGSKGLATLVFASALSIGAVAQAETLQIAALGDSLTQGYGLPQGEGFVPQLQAWLQANGQDVEILNAGVSGDTTAGGLSRVGWTLTDEVDGMIVSLGGNDLLRGIDPAVARENLAGILQAAADREVEVMLVGLDAPSNYGAGYKQAFESMYPELASEYDAVYAPNFFQGILDAGVTQETGNAVMQPDGIHPSAEGVALIVPALGPKVIELVEKIR